MTKRSCSASSAPWKDVETAKGLAVFDDCTEAHYSPDGKTLRTIHEAGAIKLWDVPPRKPLFLMAFAACIWCPFHFFD